MSTALAHSWLDAAHLREVVDHVGTPAFIYSEARFRKNLHRVRRAADEAGLGDRVEFYIPFFPNSNPHHLKPLLELDGFGVLVQLPSEYELLRSHGFERFIVSPGHVCDAEIDYWNRTGCPTFLGSIDEVAHSLAMGSSEISVRIDSLDSGKPGIKYGELDRLSGLLKEHGRDVTCIEVYCGSGNSLEEMLRTVEEMFEVFLEHFPTARAINFAGGHGFDYDAYAEEEKHFDWRRYFVGLADAAKRLGIPDDIRFLFEPARDVLADTGVLLLSVERSVISTPVSSIVVTDGTRMLMPSAQLRDRNHNTAFLDANMNELVEGPGVRAAIRGRTILRNDYILPRDVWVPKGVDDTCYLVILDTGAYCATQHMEFLNVPPPAEVLVHADGSLSLISEAGNEFDKWRNLLPEPRPITARTGVAGRTEGAEARRSGQGVSVTLGSNGKSSPAVSAVEVAESNGAPAVGVVEGLDFEQDIADTADPEAPFAHFARWLEAAAATEPNDPNAMAVATVGDDGLPNVRMVLLKDYDPSGFVFFTNSTSAKGAELKANMQAAAVLHWKTLRRQIRIRGPVETIGAEEADRYFASRPRNSRIGAWASHQSAPLERRKVLEEAFAEQEGRFVGRDVPRPPHWIGYRIRPVYLEFWSERPFRLHDRVVFTRAVPDGPWKQGRLYP